MQTFGAQYVVYEDSGFLIESVMRVYPFLKKILFLVGFEPWCGKGDIHYPAQTIEHIFSIPDPDKKFVVIQKYWATEEDQRNEGLKILRELGCDWCLVIDDDEMYNHADLRRGMQIAEQSSHQLFCVHHQIYWKDRYTCISPLQVALLSLCRTDGSVTFSKARNTLVAHPGTWTTFPANEVLCHHYSYVRDNEKMLRKISTFSHAAEISMTWYNEMWLKWTPETKNFHPVNPGSFPGTVWVDKMPQMLEELT